MTRIFPFASITEMKTPVWFPTDICLAGFFRGHGPIYHWIYPNYKIELLRTFARLWPNGTRTVLDIGAGDGVMGSAIHRFFPHTKVRGVDVVVHTLVPSFSIKDSKLHSPLLRRAKLLMYEN